MSENDTHHLAHGSALTKRIIGLAIKVHRTIGPGLLESVYEACLCHELVRDGLTLVRQAPLSLLYDGVRLIPTALESDTRPPQRRHGRRKPAPSEGRGPDIHVFPYWDQQRRRWRAFAHHDAEGQAGESTSTRIGINCGYRADVSVERLVIVEIKAVEHVVAPSVRFTLS